MPEQFIYKKGDHALEMYFLTEGLAEECHKRRFKDKKFNLKKGDFFGEVRSRADF
jgi:hypothetical protein